MPYGYVQTASNVARQLKELNKDYEGRRTWGQLYSAVDVDRQGALNNLQQDYSQSVLEAYQSAQQQKSAIANSALGSGYKKEAIADIDYAMSEAFEAYKQNYLQNVSAVESSAAEAVSSIDTALNTEAQRYVDLQDSAYDYLQQLYDRSQGLNNYELDTELQSMFAENSNWSKYLVPELDEEGNEIGKRLMTKQELLARNYDLDAAGTGTLNTKGIDFYDQMLNQLSQEDTRYSYYNWLATENPELYDWATSASSYNYTDAGTNFGTFKSMMGLKSTDDEYKFIERLGGLNKEEVNSMLSKFTSKAGKWLDLQTKSERESGIVQLSELTGEIHNVAETLGIAKDVEKALGMSWTQFEKLMSDYANDYVTNGEMWSDWLNKTGHNIARTGSVGTVAGSLIPGVGTAAGMIAGAAAGLIGSVVEGIGGRTSYDATNKDISKKASKAYNDLVIALLTTVNKSVND